MNSILKKTLPITLLLLSGCVHHPGFIPFRPHHLSSIDLRIGSGGYHNHHRKYKSRDYYYKRHPTYSDHYDDYHSNYKYRSDRHYGKRHHDSYNYKRNKHRKDYYRRDRHVNKHARGHGRRDR